MEYALRHAPRLPHAPAAFPVRTVLLAGHVGAGNLGAELRTERLLTVLQAAGVACRVTSYTPERTRDAFAGARQEALPPEVAGTLWRLTMQTDATIITEGAALGEAGFGQFAGAMALALAQGRPAIAAGVGADRLPQGGLGWLQAHCRDADVFCRDSASAERLAAAGLRTHDGADPVWAMDPPARQQGSALMICASHPASWPDAARPAFGRWLTALVAALDGQGDRARFVVMDDHDTAVAQELARATGGQVIRPHGQAEALSAFAAARAVISARFHGVVLGMLCGAPTLGLAIDTRLTALFGGQPFKGHPGAGGPVSPDDGELGTRLAQAIDGTAPTPGATGLRQTQRAAALAMETAILDRLGLGTRGAA